MDAFPKTGTVYVYRFWFISLFNSDWIFVSVFLSVISVFICNTIGMQKAIHVYNIKEAHFQEQLKNIMFFIVVVCFGFQEILLPLKRVTSV